MATAPPDGTQVRGILRTDPLDIRLREADSSQIQMPGMPMDGRPWRLAVRLINPGWGSSGYYSAAMLEQCAGIFATATQMYIDHPGEAEEYDRPERTIRDLAAVLATDADAQWDGANAHYTLRGE